MKNINFNNAFRSESVEDPYYFPIRKDDSGTTRYYGFSTRNGLWYIIQDDTTTGVTKYVYGKNAPSTFATNWTNKASLTYYDIFEVQSV